MSQVKYGNGYSFVSQMIHDGASSIMYCGCGQKPIEVTKDIKRLFHELTFDGEWVCFFDKYSKSEIVEEIKNDKELLHEILSSIEPWQIDAYRNGLNKA